ncbi:uncharacterized protein CELE_W09G12.10 [Caenorhabditis elegans]|uniref:Transmembrane protein n=1 Tax=Caenorhabditis elegans TaxID=6239 RepID=Q4R121_CAEEL|nr:Transmembrane protein [Caenorhabditis elegans]CCD74024.1 Transmembrane protein [Caenorhabditis elegans]|eukprot:NP_001033437.1 Uncharacterized protein CELE_W09G12.10 [Caenorhabditis elegans]
MSSSAKIYSMEAHVPAASRPVPLNTRQVLSVTITLSIFSFLYLVYAQKHALLFYIMTGLVGVFIVFIYSAGILAVLYMVARDYPEASDFDNKSASSSSSREMEESKF